MKRIDYQSPLSTYLLRRFREPAFLKALKDRDTARYEFRVWTASHLLDQCITELRHHLNTFPSIKTTASASIAIKTYIVSWRSLTDAMACLINEAFDLGLHQKDVSLGLVVRNSHVRNHGLEDIIKRYEKELETQKHIGLRNRIIHQGLLEDAGLEAIQAEEKRVELRRLIGVRASPADSAERKRAFESYLHGKQEAYQQHLERSIALIEEVGGCLQREFDRRSKRQPQPRP